MKERIIGIGISLLMITGGIIGLVSIVIGSGVGY